MFPWKNLDSSPEQVVNKTNVPSSATRGSKVHSMQRSPALLVQSRLWWLRHPPFTREQTHLNTRGRLGSLGFKPEFVKLGQEIRVASVTFFHSARKPTSFQQFPQTSGRLTGTFLQYTVTVSPLLNTTCCYPPHCSCFFLQTLGRNESTAKLLTQFSQSFLNLTHPTSSHHVPAAHAVI